MLVLEGIVLTSPDNTSYSLSMASKQLLLPCHCVLDLYCIAIVTLTHATEPVTIVSSPAG